jgi:hypothetical protein
VVTLSERCFGALPSSAGISHQHGIRDQDMVVHLGIPGPGRRMPGGRPGETSGGDAGLGASPPTTSLCDEAVQVLKGGVALGVDDLVHVLGAPDHAELGDLVGRDDELQAGTQAAHETPTSPRVVGTTDAEDGPVISEVHLTGHTEQSAS